MQGSEHLLSNEAQQRIKDIRLATEGIIKAFPRQYMKECIEHQRFPEELWQSLADTGLLGLTIPEALGGSGGGQLEVVTLMETLAGAGLAMPMLLLTAFARVPILRHGTPSQIEQFVLPSMEGKEKLCFAITEPDAGTNSFAMKTLATACEGGYRIRGQKIFISAVDQSDRMLLVARTTEASSVDHRTSGMSLFVVDVKSQGLSYNPLNIDVGWAEKQFQVFFDDVFVPHDRLIGRVDEGLAGMFDALNSERLLATAMGVGIGSFALEKAVSYSQSRKPFGRPIGSYQSLQHRIAEAKAEIEAARLMMITAAVSFDAGANAGPQANMAKFLASRAAVKAVEAAIQTHGGYGFDKDFDVITLWPSARLLEVAPINNEMLLNFIGEHVLGLPRSY